MIQHGIKGIEFIRADTFTPSMLNNPAHRMIQLCRFGRLDGEDPEYAFKDASDVEEDIRHAIHSTRILFITFGTAGTTGAGAAPVIARMSRQMGIVTVGVAITPFAFEGRGRWRRTEKWMNELKKM